MTTRSEQELELARLEQENELATLEAENSQLEGKAPQEEGIHELGGDTLGLISRSAKGLAQRVEDVGTPFVEPIRKAGYAAHAAIGASDTEDYNRRFRQFSAEDQAAMAKTRHETPEPVKDFGTTMGLMSTMGLGGATGESAAGFLPAAKRVLGMGALGAAERGTSNPNPNQFWDSEEGAKGAGIAGALQTGIEIASPLLSKGINKDWLLENARERANKAATGQNKAFQKKATNVGAATGDMDAFDYAGDYLLGRHKEGAKPIVGFFDRPESILPKLESAAEEQAPRLGDLTKQIDEAYPKGLVDPRNIERNIGNYAEEMPHTGQTAPVINRLNNEKQLYGDASRLGRIPRPGEGGGSPNIDELLTGQTGGKNISFGDLRSQKQGYKFDPGDPTKQSFGKEGSNELYRVLMREENDAAARAALDPNLSPELRANASNFRQMKAEEQANMLLQQATSDRVNANKANRLVAPSEYGSAGIGAMVAGWKGIPAALAHRVVRTRGSAFAARTLNAAHNLVEKAPDSLGRYSNILNDAMRRGNTAFTATHGMLMENDSEYQRLIGDRYDRAQLDWQKRQIDSFGPMNQ